MSQAGRETDNQTGKQTDAQMNGQTIRYSDRQTERQIGRQCDDSPQEGLGHWPSDLLYRHTSYRHPTR